MSCQVSGRQLSIMPGIQESIQQPTKEYIHPKTGWIEYSPPKTITNDGKVNDIFYRKKIEASKPEGRKMSKKASTGPAQSKKIEILPYVQAQPSRKSLEVEEVKVIKGSYNKYPRIEKKHVPIEDRCFSNGCEGKKQKKSNKHLIPFNIKINKFAKRRNIQECYKQLDDIKSAGLAPDQYSYNPILDALIKLGRNKEAQELWQRMQSENVMPDQTTYNTVMKIHVKDKDHQTARALINTMWITGVNPDQTTYNTVMIIYGILDDLNNARALLDEMERMGIQPDAITYTPIMEIYLRAGNFEGGWGLFNEMWRKTIKLDEKICEIFLVICLNNRVLKYFIPLLKHMESAGIALCPIIKKNMQTLYHAEIKKYTDNEQLTKGAELFEEMKGAGIRLDINSFNIMLQSYLKYGILEDEDENFQQQAIALQEYVKNLRAAMHDNKIEPDEEARELLKQLDLTIKEHKETGKDLEPILEIDVQSDESSRYNPKEDGGCSGASVAKTEPRGIKIAEHASDTSMPDTPNNEDLYHQNKKKMQAQQKERLQFCNRLNDCVDKGDIEGGRAVFVEMLQKGIIPDTYIYNILMKGCLKMGDLEGAKRVLNDMDQKKIPADAFTFSTMLQLYKQKHDLKGAQALREDMEKRKIKPNIFFYNIFLAILVEKKDIQGAKAIMREMDQEGIPCDACTYTTLMKYYVNLRKLNECQSLLNEMYQREIKPSNATFTTLNGLYVDIQGLKGGIALFEELKRNGLEPDAKTYSRAIKMYCYSNDPSLGIALVDEMKKKEIKLTPDIYSCLMVLYLKNEEPDKGIATYNQMKQEKIKLKEADYIVLKDLYRKKQDWDNLKALFRELRSNGTLSKSEAYTDFLQYTNNKQYQKKEQFQAKKKGRK